MGALLSLILMARLDPVLGLNYYAIRHPKFPCDQALQVFHGVEPKAISILWSFFGSDNTCLHRFLAQPGRKIVEIHLGNKGALGRYTARQMEVCLTRHKGGSCRSALRHRIGALIRALGDVDQDTQLFLSPGLEDSFSDNAWRHLVHYLYEDWPYEIVRNSWTSRVSLGKRVVSELHDPGYQTGFEILNNDGWDVCELGNAKQCLALSDVLRTARRQLSGGGAYFLWFGDIQGLHGGLPPRHSPIPNRRNYYFNKGSVRLLNKTLKEMNNDYDS